MPSFALATDIGARFCAAHMHPSMVNRMKKPCSFTGCLRAQINALPYVTRARVCSAHRQPGMVNTVLTVSKLCRLDGCTMQASFSHKGRSPFQLCGSHRYPGMVSASYKHCTHDDCRKRASFAAQSKPKPTVCGTHRQPGMADVYHKKNWGAFRTRKSCAIAACAHSSAPKKSLSTELWRMKERHVMFHIKVAFPEHLSSIRLD